MVDQDSILILTELPWYNFLKMAKDPLTLLPMTGGGLIPHPFIWAGLSDLLYQKNDILRLLRARHKTYFSPGLLACSLSCLQEASHHIKSLTVLTLPCVEEANAPHVEGRSHGGKERDTQPGPWWPSHLSSDNRHVTKGTPSWMFGSAEFSDDFRPS